MTKRSIATAAMLLSGLLGTAAQAEEMGKGMGMGMMNHDGMNHAMAPATGAKQAPQGKRTAIVMTQAEREIILQEMRGMLEGIQLVTAGLANDDLKAVAEAARPQGMHVMHGIPGSLRNKLPMEFKQLGMGMHKDFDQMALDAESLGDAKHTLRQVNTLLQKCVACHSIYQIRVAGKK